MSEMNLKKWLKEKGRANERGDKGTPDWSVGVQENAKRKPHRDQAFRPSPGREEACIFFREH